MPKIKGSEWYTAAGLGGIKKIEGSERVLLTQSWLGYRRSLKDLSKEEINYQIQALKENGIMGEIRISRQNHTGIPAGTPFFQVSDAKSVLNLEKTLIKMGIELPVNRFDVYKQQLQLNREGGRK